MRFLNQKNNKRKIVKESLQLYRLAEKATKNLINQISSFEELDVKFLNINQ